MAATIAYVFAIMPILWNESSVSSIVWTGTGMALLVASSFISGSWRLADRTLTCLVVAYLVTYGVGTYVSYWLTGPALEARRDLLVPNAILLVAGLFFYLSGAMVASDRRWGATCGLLIAIVSTIIYAGVRMDEFTSVDLQYRLRGEGLNIDYQQIGDSLAICALALLARARRRVNVRKAFGWLGFCALVVGALFIIPSRSAALFGTGCIVLAMMLILRGKSRWIAVVAVACAVIAIEGLPINDIADGSRFQTLVSDDATDESWAQREEILRNGLKVLHEHPLAGEWAFQIERMGSSGSYIHNALDIWIQAGLLPFSLFVTLWGCVAWRWNKLRKFSRFRASRALPLVAFALLSWVLSRQALYAVPMFCVGHLAGSRIGTARRSVRERAKAILEQIDRRQRARETFQDGLAAASSTAAMSAVLPVAAPAVLAGTGEAPVSDTTLLIAANDPTMDSSNDETYSDLDFAHWRFTDTPGELISND